MAERELKLVHCAVRKQRDFRGNTRHLADCFVAGSVKKIECNNVEKQKKATSGILRLELVGSLCNCK